MTGRELAEARALDAADPLAGLRARFTLPEGVTYLDGNSLGALPAHAARRLEAAARREWGDGLIRSWNAAGWIDQPARLGARIARLIGAAPDCVTVADSTSVNLFKLMTAALGARPGRPVILTEPGNFPTDLYIAGAVARLVPGAEVRTAPADSLAGLIGPEVALVALTHVHYKTGAVHDMAAIAARARAAGALCLFDLSHSAGAVELDLAAAGVDLAVGCGYKYLNGGPGAPAFLYVAPPLRDVLQSPLQGWMGHAEPFAFEDAFVRAPGIAAFLCGTPPILGMAALEAGLDTFEDVAMADIARKARALTAYFIDAVERRCAGADLRLVSPRDPARRGSHVSFGHADPYPVMQALIARGVIGDVRAPDVLRFGFTPLYTRFEDAWRAADTLGAVLESGAWRAPEFSGRARVT